MAYNSNNKQELIDTITLNETNEIRVSKVIDTDGNLVSIDIRTFFDNDGVMTPTKKGIRLSSDDTQRLVGILVGIIG